MATQTAKTPESTVEDLTFASNLYKLHNSLLQNAMEHLWQELDAGPQDERTLALKKIVQGAWIPEGVTTHG